MGGRPPVVGLLAVAVAVFLASAVATPPAAAEFSIPGLFEPKPKAAKRKPFRPTIPSRNPTRVTAGVSANAVSPPVADNSEAAVVAGTSSSASVALALPAPAPAEDAAEASKKARTESDIAADNAAAGEGETASSQDPADATAEESADETEKPVVLAQADAQGPETGPEDRASASAEPDGDEAAAEPADVPEPAESDAKPEETAQAGATEQDETDGEPSAEPTEENTEDPDEAAASVQTAPAAEKAEADEDGEESTASTEDDTAKVNELVEAQPVATPEAPRSHTASVVLQVAPPPEPVLATAVVPEAGAVAAEDASKAETDEPEETKIAALTPPDATVSEAPPVNAVPEDSAALDAAPSEDEKVGAEDADRESATDESATEEDKPAAETDEKAEPNSAAENASPPDDEKNVEEKVEDEKVETEKVESEEAAAESKTESASDEETASETSAPSEETAQTPAEGETAAEEASPPPPPAHPIVAEIRTKLEEPDRYKTVAAADLEALKAFYGTHEGPPLWVTESGFTDKARAVMTEIGKADDWGLDAASFELPPEADLLATPNAIADDELQLSIAILSYARDAQIGRLSPSTVSKLFDQHPTLRDPKEVLVETAAADAPGKYLLSLHPQHTQFKRLQEALVRARDSAKATGRDPDSDRNVQLITINMERWRWMPRRLGNYYVWNNVPEYNVRVMKGGEAIYQEKTIVGQYKYATPFFSAPMKNIVFHPNWTVPPTIIKEDLAPKLQGPGGGGFFGNSKEATLARYGLTANYKGQRINADTVDWNNVNIHAYTFTQEPGPANVLGKFKFNFPNKHAIYMHDTPQRELFAETTRTLSHGCIRVNQPDRFAALLLAEDKGWTMGHVQSLVAKGPQSPTVISLNHDIPVHLTYFTAVVDRNGTVSAYGDIYGIDNRMASKLFRNPASFPVPATPAVAEEGSSSRTQPQARRRSSNGFDSFISGLFGN